MTNQEVFDKVATHLLTQNKKAICPITGKCQYRTSEGLKCAAGIMISDEEYSPEMENRGVSNLIAVHKLEKLAPVYALLHKLQCIHDIAGVADWRSELRMTAQIHNLSAAILDNLN